MSDPVSLAEKRADKANDCRLWTPLDALKAAIRDIESGEVCPQAIYIAMKSVPDEQQQFTRPFYCAGGNNLELSGLLAQHLWRLCE